LLKNTRIDSKEILLFLAKFLALSAPLYLIIWMKLDFFPLQVAVAQQVSALLGLVGVETTVSQYLVKGSNFTLEIVEECTGWRDMLAFAALVFATRKGGKLKALLLLPVIYIANILRLAATFVIGVYAPEIAKFAHAILFQVGMLALVFSLWFFLYLMGDDKI